jgi:hypothetical protein
LEYGKSVRNQNIDNIPPNCNHVLLPEQMMKINWISNGHGALVWQGKTIKIDEQYFCFSTMGQRNPFVMRLGVLSLF